MTTTPSSQAVRNLVLVLGDQLDETAAGFDRFDPARDVVWMAEAPDESTHVWSHKARIVLFLSAMRHFRDRLLRKGYRVEYRAMEDTGAGASLAEALETAAGALRPSRLIMTQPGEWRVGRLVDGSARKLGLPLEVRPDRHFLCPSEQFDAYAQSRKSLVMEFFYRDMRKRTGVLMDNGKPCGGAWNFDRENRQGFGRKGPPSIPVCASFAPDAVTREVFALVNRRFATHPGRLDRFDWPVTPEQAELALDAFVATRLVDFGRYQDAIWTGQPFLYHSRLSASLNLKLLDPRRVIAAAERAFRTGRAPLHSVEGYIRQVIGWREYVRGVYWRFMPEYAACNALDAHHPLPGFYWTGETDMHCLRECIAQTLEYGFAHHIQRLMVTGLFALLLGVDPLEVHKWYLAIYVDAVEWVEMPNTLGMSQFADGGLVSTKPYAASGKYIRRMSNYCNSCRFDPEKSTGDSACPFTTLYWDFLLRHARRLQAVPRMTMQLRNASRLSISERRAIRRQAEAVSRRMT